MSKLELPEGQDNVIVRNQEVYGFLPKDVIDRMGDTSTQLATEDQTALGAINELKSNLTELGMPDFANMTNIGTGNQTYTPTANGYLHFHASGLGSGNAVVIKLNNSSGTWLGSFGAYAGGSTVDNIFPLKKGQTYYLQATGSSTTWSFVPLG